jgi:hypothetical protein
MKSKMISLTAAVVMLASIGNAAVAATVESISGNILVNRGNGFVAVTEPIEVQAGDLVMANPGSRAIVRYSGDCRERVEPGAIVRVVDAQNCPALDEKNGPAQAGVDGPVDGGVAGIAGLSTETVAIGIGVAAAIGVGVLIAGRSDHASP